MWVASSKSVPVTSMDVVKFSASANPKAEERETTLGKASWVSEVADGEPLLAVEGE